MVVIVHVGGNGGKVYFSEGEDEMLCQQQSLLVIVFNKPLGFAL